MQDVYERCHGASLVSPLLGLTFNTYGFDHETSAEEAYQAACLLLDRTKVYKVTCGVGIPEDFGKRGESRFAWEHGRFVKTGIELIDLLCFSSGI